MQKVLITGGAGFIGSNLALKLINKGYYVRVLDNLSEQVHGIDPNKSYTYSLIKGKVDFIKGSVTSEEDWEKALKDISIVVHLAAETGTGQSMYDINHYVETNVSGTAKLLEYITNKPHNIEKILLASSRAVYGEGKYECANHGVVYPISREDSNLEKGDFSVKCPVCGESVNVLLTDENSKLHPSSVYGFTKQSQEQLASIVCDSLNIPLVVYRFQNVYGPGQSLKNPYTGILSIFSTQIKNGNNINIFEDGKETRDFVYIEDITDAIVLGIETKLTKNTNTFNVGSGERVDVLTVANTLKNKYNSDVSIFVTGNYRLGDIKDNIADLTNISKLLGYQPKVTFKHGISNFVDWVENQEVEEDCYEKSISVMKEKGLFK